MTEKFTDRQQKLIDHIYPHGFIHTFRTPGREDEPGHAYVGYPKPNSDVDLRTLDSLIKREVLVYIGDGDWGLAPQYQLRRERL